MSSGSWGPCNIAGPCERRTLNRTSKTEAEACEIRAGAHSGWSMAGCARVVGCAKHCPPRSHETLRQCETDHHLRAGTIESNDARMQCDEQSMSTSTKVLHIPQMLSRESSTEAIKPVEIDGYISIVLCQLSLRPQASRPLLPLKASQSHAAAPPAPSPRHPPRAGSRPHRSACPAARSRRGARPRRSA